MFDRERETKSEIGQGLVEYALVLALVVILVILVFQWKVPKIKKVFSDLVVIMDESEAAKIETNNETTGTDADATSDVQRPGPLSIITSFSPRTKKLVIVVILIVFGIVIVKRLSEIL